MPEEQGGGALAAKAYAETCLANDAVPRKAQGRVYLELADLSKREKQWDQSRHYYSVVCSTWPYDAQGWHGWFKMEEEQGEHERASVILKDGLRFCEYSELLLACAIKHEERLGGEHASSGNSVGSGSSRCVGGLTELSTRSPPHPHHATPRHVTLRAAASPPPLTPQGQPVEERQGERRGRWLGAV